MSDTGGQARSSCYALFNNATFADAVFVADSLMSARDDGLVTARLVAADLRISDSVVRPVMVRLLAAGLLGELPKVGAANGPRLFHRRNPDCWAALIDLITSTGHPLPSMADQGRSEARDITRRAR